MNDIRSALDGLYSDGSGKKILMYGEPWTGGSVAISDGCSQSKAGSLNSRVGMFCDSYCDIVNTHKVKTETVNVVFLRPILYGFNHILSVHQLI